MKKIRNIKLSSIFAGLVGISVACTSVYAQEYDDMYFNKSDRKTIKTQNKALLSTDLKTSGSTNYTQATKSTEVYSAKNVNPEYIARYKATESNEVQDRNTPNKNYNSSDYFIEDYNEADSSLGIHQNQIDYAALNKRDQMSYSNYNNAGFNNPSWRMNPYMRMGYGRPWGFDPVMMGYDPFMMGYDPFMMGYGMGMGYGPGMSMGMGMGFGTGFYPSMSYNIAMSWGTGYNPWGGWGGYPYSPYGMRGFNNPWAFGPSYGFGYGGLHSMYGFSRPIYVINQNEYNNGRNISYQPRTVRNSSVQRVTSTGAENVRISSADSKIRIPDRRTTSNNTPDGRISRDYSKSQNEYYNTSRRTTSSTERIAASSSSRNSYVRSSGSSTGYSSPINTNKPSRLSNSSSGVNRSSSNYNNGGSRSSSSYSSPSRSNSSFERNSYSSGSNNSSYSSGSRYSSGSGSTGTRSGSSSGASRSGGRQ